MTRRMTMKTSFQQLSRAYPLLMIPNLLNSATSATALISLTIANIMFVEQIIAGCTSNLYVGMVGSTLSTRSVVLFVSICFL